MKVTQEMYANAGVTAWNKSQPEEDIYENELKLKTGNKRANQGRTNSAPVGPICAWGRCYRLTVVCVLLLCVLLLAAVTVLGIEYNNLTTDINQLQTSYNNLTLERDRLQWETSALQNALVKLGWIRFGSSIYNTSSDTSSWTESRQDCIRRGADLAIINSTEEEEFIDAYFGSTDVWLGLTNINTTEFNWGDSLPKKGVYWLFTKPTNYRTAMLCNNYKQNDAKPAPYPDPTPAHIPEATPSLFPDPYRRLTTELVLKSRVGYNCKVTVVGICEMKLFNTAHGG